MEPRDDGPRGQGAGPERTPSPLPHTPILCALLDHRSALVELCRRMTPSSQDTEDVAQEVLLRVILLLRSGVCPRHPWSFVSAVAWRVAREMGRARAREPSKPADGIELLEPAVEADPEVHLQDHETARHVDEALAALSPRQRQIVRERIWQGRSIATIASGLKITESTAREHWAKALSHLRAALRDIAEG